MENPVFSKTDKTNFNLFINLTATTVINPSLKFKGEFQVILYFDKEDKLIVGEIDFMGDEELTFMGKLVPADKFNETRDFLKNTQGTNFFRIGEEKIKEKIKRMGIKRFVLEQTGILL